MKRETINKLFRAAALTAVLAVLAVASTSCSKDMPPSPGTGAGEGMELRLMASIADDFGGAQADTKAPVVGKTFPAGVHRLSLAIFKADKSTKWAEGYDNILAEVNVNNTGTQTWRFQLKGSSVWQNALSFPTGTSGDMWVTALYPYNVSAVASGGGSASMITPFDLTTAAQQADQSDVMYAEPTKLTIASDDLSRAVLLPFKHFFAMFEFQIAPIFNDASKITKITVQNGTSETWIANKGTVQSTNSTFLTDYGDIFVTDNRTMTMGVYNTYRVLVPQPTLVFASAYNDGDITIRFTDGLNATVAPLPLKIKKEWLAATEGLKAGNRYTFKMLYHNNLVGEGKLDVTGWSVNGALIDGWGVGAPSDAMLYWSSGALVKTGPLNGTTPTIADATKSSYNGYTYNASNAANNGGYRAEITDALAELPFYQLEVAKTDEGSAVIWEDAWAICALKTTDGGGWRLPRLSELALCLFNNAGLITADGYTDFYSGSSGTLFWSATESSASSAWRLAPATRGLTEPKAAQTGLKTAVGGSVRCVRELPRQAPAGLAATEGYLDWRHPATVKSGTVRDDGSSSNKAVTLAGTTKSYNGYTYDASNATNNGGYLTTFATAMAEKAYYKLEVSKTEAAARIYSEAWAACKAQVPVGAWRLPRLSEAAWMYFNKTALEQTPGFAALNDGGYWIATEYCLGDDAYGSGTGESWYLYKSGSDWEVMHGIKSYYANTVRCVREL